MQVCYIIRCFVMRASEHPCLFSILLLVVLLWVGLYLALAPHLKNLGENLQFTKSDLKDILSSKFSNKYEIEENERSAISDFDVRVSGGGLAGAAIKIIKKNDSVYLRLSSFAPSPIHRLLLIIGVLAFVVFTYFLIGLTSMWLLLIPLFVIRRSGKSLIDELSVFLQTEAEFT